jgi:transposase
VAKVINKYRVNKYYNLEIEDSSFNYSRKLDLIAQEIALDGVYVMRTSVKEEVMSSQKTVIAYKNLSQVEKAFRCYKSIDLKVRPIYHYKGDRVKAHIFLCMLAYYVEWHLKKALKSLLFEDEDTENKYKEIVRASRSKSAELKDRKKRNKDDYPLHSFRTLLEDLGTICLVEVECNLAQGKSSFQTITRPTRLQQKALDLVDISLICTQ